jgi:hypothetical protein
VQTLYPRMSEWGNPPGVNALVLLFEHIEQQRERGELKHLSNLRKRNHSLSSGERKGISPNRCPCDSGVVGHCRWELQNFLIVEHFWKVRP